MISVCIATHNGEKYIKKQLESILSQLDFSDEIVISDDGSTDQTINLIQSLEDKRIKILPINNVLIIQSSICLRIIMLLPISIMH